MGKGSHLFFVFYFLLGFSIALPAQRKLQTYIDYIDKYSNLAVAHKDKYKIPASIILAQGILESGAGLSDLAKESNNHFGIKCHSEWTGEKVYRRDDGPNDCFRKYNNAEESFEDHSEFLLKYPRYSVLFTYDITDYTAWAKGLQTCGYATDKGYANKLIRIIEDYELYKYDVKKSSSSINTTVRDKDKIIAKVEDKDENKKQGLLRDIYKTYNLIYVLAKEGDSFGQISGDTGFKVKDLIKYNEVPEDFPLRKGDIVYLQKKKSKADKPHFEHLVKIGESMHSISQRYGIQLKSLYKMNKKNPDYVPTEGDVLRLR